MARVSRMWSVVVCVMVAASGLVGCTIKDTTAPGLQGPSEMSLAFSLQAVPDVLTQDGASQSQIVVQARDANGQPARSVTFRADIRVGATLTDFGSLSARTLVTGNDGRATLTYTAPPAPQTGVDTNQQVTIQITPFGSDFANTIVRTVNIRLIPPGILLPGGPTPSFTFTPSGPTAFSDVTFDASASTAAPSTQIISFAWNFGDGSTGSGVKAFHRFAAGTYVVTLTATDTNGVSASTQQTVTVGAGALPTAAFVFSPSAPVVNQDIFFNASTSRPGTGRSIARYDWNFGSGSLKTGVMVTKSYDVPGAYAVVLTVTDDVGQTATSSTTVTVGTVPTTTPTARFTISPSPANSGQVVTFDASSSSATAPSVIVRYEWDFGDSNGIQSTSQTTIQHVYIQQAPKPEGVYTIRLTVFDSQGNSATITHTLLVY